MGWEKKFVIERYYKMSGWMFFSFLFALMQNETKKSSTNECLPKQVRNIVRPFVRLAPPHVLRVLCGCNLCCSYVYLDSPITPQLAHRSIEFPLHKSATQRCLINGWSLSTKKIKKRHQMTA